MQMNRLPPSSICCRGQIGSIIVASLLLVACSARPAIVSPTPQTSLTPLTPASAALEAQLLVHADATQNWLVSPVSIAQAFGMVQLGAANETASQIERSLGIAQGEPGAAFLSRQRAMLVDAGPDVTVSVENALWVAKDFRLQPSFVAGAERFYGASARTVDFRDPRSSSVVNHWVETATKGLIPAMLVPGDINPDTASLLTNATYFKARWSEAFRPAGRGPFTTGSGRTIDLARFQDQRSLRYLETKLYQAISIDYGDQRRFAMELYLPKPGTSLDTARRAILEVGVETVSQDLGAAQPVEVELTVPEFEIDTRMDLGAALRAIGLTLPFDSQRADFSRMADRFLYIDKALHVTRLRVDRLGTEAAAATAIAAMPSSAPPPFNGPRIVVDRPFMLAVRDTHTGAWLFTGFVVEPKSLQPQRDKR